MNGWMDSGWIDERKDVDRYGCAIRPSAVQSKNCSPMAARSNPNHTVT